MTAADRFEALFLLWNLECVHNILVFNQPYFIYLIPQYFKVDFISRMRVPKAKGVEYAGRRSFSPKVRGKKSSKKFLARDLLKDERMVQFDYESGEYNLLCLIKWAFLYNIQSWCGTFHLFLSYFLRIKYK